MGRRTFSTTVGIIGGGASGALTAAQIALQARIPCKVILFDPAPVLGAGLAYGTPCLSHLMNVPAGKLSAFPDRSDHFLQWLNHPERPREIAGERVFAGGDFVPRPLYGAYLNSVLKDAFAASSCQARLIRRESRAVDFIPHGEGGTVVSADATTDDVRQLVLALGNLPPRDPLPSSHPVIRSNRYISNIWANDSLKEVLSEESLMIAGTGLTAIDTVLKLLDQGHRGRIILTSRGGRLPQPHAATAAHRDFFSGIELPKSTRELVRRIRTEIDMARECGDDWRGVIDSIRPHTQSLWLCLTESERRRFLRHVRAFWESHRHRCPSDSWRRIQRLLASGQLEVVPGRIQDAVIDGTRMTFTIRPRGMRERRMVKVDRFVNCIGPESNFRQHFNARLIVNLIARGTIHPDPLFLGLNATPDGRVIDGDGNISPGLSLIGPPLKGILWETTAMPEIRVQAQRTAARVVDALSLQDWSI